LVTGDPDEEPSWDDPVERAKQKAKAGEEYYRYAERLASMERLRACFKDNGIPEGWHEMVEDFREEYGIPESWHDEREPDFW
jgi:hypothetical protein